MATADCLYSTETSAKEAEELNSFGISYASGYSIPQDHQIALLYFRKAAKLEHADALYNLSVAYEYGFGVDKDQPLSMKYHLKAASRGSLRVDSFFSDPRYLNFSPSVFVRVVGKIFDLKLLPASWLSFVINLGLG